MIPEYNLHHNFRMIFFPKYPLQNFHLESLILDKIMHLHDLERIKTLESFNVIYTYLLI